MMLIRPGLFVVGLLVAGAALGAEPEAGGQPPVPLAVPTFDLRLGVDGEQTDNGFVVTRVKPGTRAAKLVRGGRVYRLEPGDVIKEVDGVPLTQEYTLRDAIAGSNGTVDLVVKNRRGRPPILEFDNVRLDRVRRR
jgi:S1-C subfamily serine protease